MTADSDVPRCVIDSACRLSARHRGLCSRVTVTYQDPEGVIRPLEQPLYSWWGKVPVNARLVAETAGPGPAGNKARAVEADRRMLYGVADPGNAVEVATRILFGDRTG